MYLFTDLNYPWELPDTNQNTLNRIFNVLLKRMKTNKFDYAVSLGYEPVVCNGCGAFNRHMRFSFSVVGRNITITGLSYVDNQSSTYCYSNKNCPAYGLNPNSVEFVSITRKISKEEAKKIILERNSSPFYRTNYKSDEEYAKAQSRSSEWFIKNGKDRDSWISKANHSRSLNGLIERHGYDKGTTEFARICSQKQNTIDNFKIRYKDEWKELYKSYLENSAAVGKLSDYIEIYGTVEGNKNYIKKSSSQHNCGTVTDYNSLIQHTISYIKKDFLHVCNFYPIKEKLMLNNIISKSIGIFINSLDDLISDVKLLYPKIQSTTYVTVPRAGKTINKMSYTDRGELLRSKFEATFYVCLREANIQNIIVNKRYPNNRNYFDFYLPEIDLYIELCGLMDWDDYAENIKKKENLPYSILFIKEEKDFTESIKTILRKFNEL